MLIRRGRHFGQLLYRSQWCVMAPVTWASRPALEYQPEPGPDHWSNCGPIGVSPRDQVRRECLPPRASRAVAALVQASILAH